MEVKQILVIKIGGTLTSDTQGLKNLARNLSNLETPLILIHGGGIEASDIMEKLGIQPVYIEGRRVTDAPSLDIVVSVYAGLINKRIVALLQAHGINAAGFSGADLDLIRAQKRVSALDYGFAGDIELVNEQMILQLLEQGLTPVFAPVTHDGQGQLLNTNADTIAARIASSLSGSARVKLYYLFDQRGVLSDPADKNSAIETLSIEKYQELKGNMITKGMIPKLDNGFAALQNGVNRVYLASYEALEDLQDNSGTELRL